MYALLLLTLLSGGQDKHPVVFSQVLNADIPKDHLEGKYLVLDFWQTWCAPCIASFEETNTLMAQYDPEEIVFANMTDEIDKLDRVKKILNVYPFEGLQLIDEKRKTLDYFKVNSFPTVVMLDPDGSKIWEGHPDDLNPQLIHQLTGIQTRNQHKKVADEGYSLSLTKSDSEIVGTVNASYDDIKDQTDIQMLSSTIGKILSFNYNRFGIDEFASPKRVFSNDPNMPYLGVDVRGKFDHKRFSDTEIVTLIETEIQDYFSCTLSVVSQQRDVWQLEVKDAEKLIKKQRKLKYQSLFSYEGEVDAMGQTLGNILKACEIASEDYFDYLLGELPEKYQEMTFDMKLKLKNMDAVHKKFADYGLALVSKPMTVRMIQIDFDAPIQLVYDPRKEIRALEQLYDPDFDANQILGKWNFTDRGVQVDLHFYEDRSGNVKGKMTADGITARMENLQIKNNQVAFEVLDFDIKLWLTDADNGRGMMDNRLIQELKRNSSL